MEIEFSMFFPRSASDWIGPRESAPPQSRRLSPVSPQERKKAWKTAPLESSKWGGLPGLALYWSLFDAI